MSAGTNAPFGFQPYARAGRSEAPLMQVDVIATQDQGVMAEGDAVTWDAGATGGIQVAAAGDVIVGVIDSFKQIAGQFIPWNPQVAALTAAQALIYWMPGMVYRVQGDVTALSLAQRFLNANHVAGTQTTGFGGHSTQYLNGAALAATNTFGWRVWDYLREEDQAIGDTYPIYLVTNNRSAWANQIAGPT